MNDGGPAFPVRVLMPYKNGHWKENLPGISMRDYFAATASEEDIKHHQKTHNYNNELLPREAARYRYADAMLAQRATQTTK